MSKITEVDWSGYASQYDNMVKYNPSYQKLLATLVSAFSSLNLGKGDSIQDWGGGTGNFAIEYAKINKEVKVTLIDSDHYSLERAEKKAHGLSNVEIVNCDIEHYDGPQANAINMMHALYVTRSKNDPDKPERILKNVYTKLKSGGQFYLTDIQKLLVFKIWKKYIFLNVLKKENYNLLRTIKIFKKNNEVRKANINIEMNQRNGNFILNESIEECIAMVKKAGFIVTGFNNEFYNPGKYGPPIDYQIISTKM
jgi:ubiquinone/menaquinone biosynthesis C-methylase UbiE